MVNIEEAKEKAVKLSGRNDIDNCTEYSNAYVFSKKGEMSFGGELPIVILKESGKAVNMIHFIDEVHDGSEGVEHSI